MKPNCPTGRKNYAGERQRTELCCPAPPPAPRVPGPGGVVFIYFFVFYIGPFRGTLNVAITILRTKNIYE